MAHTNQIVFSDGTEFVDQTDYARLNAMSDEEVLAAAAADPDAQPLSDAQLRGMRRLADIPGQTLQAKLKHLANENKKLVSVRYDADVIAFFRSKGRGYQKLMNSVLREYMNREMHISTANL